MNNGGGDGTSCFKIKIRTDATKLTNVRITRFRQCRDWVRESEMFIKDEAKIASRVSGIKRSVLYFSTKQVHALSFIVDKLPCTPFSPYLTASSNIS